MNFRNIECNEDGIPAMARKVLNSYQLDHSYIPRYSLGSDVVVVVAVSGVLFLFCMCLFVDIDLFMFMNFVFCHSV